MMEVLISTKEAAHNWNKHVIGLTVYYPHTFPRYTLCHHNSSINFVVQGFSLSHIIGTRSTVISDITTKVTKYWSSKPANPYGYYR